MCTCVSCVNKIKACLRLFKSPHEGQIQSLDLVVGVGRGAQSVFTCVRGLLLEADVAHPDGGQTPASLGDRRGPGGAAVAEALPAGTAVMLGVVVLEDRVTLMAHLAGAGGGDTKNNKKNHTITCY